MLAFDRCQRCLRIAKSFYGKKFEICASSHRESGTFRTWWAEADANLTKKENAARRQYNARIRCSVQKRCGWRLSRYYWFIRIQDWNRWYNFTPEVLGYKKQTIRDEMSGTIMEGVVCLPTPGAFLHEMLVLEYWSDEIRGIDELVVDDEERLREKEPAETFAQMNAAEIKKQVPDSPYAMLVSLTITSTFVMSAVGHYTCIKFSNNMAPRWHQKTIAPRALKKNKKNLKKCPKVNRCF